ncbi:YeiH family protein [Zhihengliuella salsuginis]|uniref:UPF0324 membrane protein Cgl0015/cg0018 n=1 Tax=Zhihengliuella salsuginis TaxID=578222 RepID=A0ABQ3GIU6_9MICC|nr:putative sulfate exporter family transporter [Zhihengliuella salsuginis]GHD05998.1 UPF0324 membrane protein Cgl0015/cg0018 [Zhihengliuella salsuginis]
MLTETRRPVRPQHPRGRRTAPARAAAVVLDRAPGLAACLAGAALAWPAAHLVPQASPLLIAILAGALWRNLAPVPAVLAPGVEFAARPLLRAGIVLLGLQLPLAALAGLGPGVLLVAAGTVVVTFGVTLWIGRALGVEPGQRLLIAAGFSICGAAAVAAVQQPARARQDQVAAAVALVVLYGTAMIPLVPFLGGLLGLDAAAVGMWIGASTHEVAQVVAAGGAVGGGALAVAVTVKLARVVMLAPVVAGISVYMRRRHASGAGRRPPIVPVFVAGFLVAVLLRSTGVLPEPALAAAAGLQSALLTAAMFALGVGVHLPSLVRLGGRPVLLGLCATAVVLAVSLAGVGVFPPA